MARSIAEAEHVFIQALLARGIMKEEDAKAMHNELVRKNGNYDQFKKSVSERLEFVQLKLQRCKFEHANGDKVVYVSIINTVGGELAKMATRLSMQQVAFFRTVVEQIASAMSSAKLGLSSREALAVDILAEVAPEAAAADGGAGPSTQGGTPLVKLSIPDREAALALLVADGWLEAVDGGERFRVGPRSFLELSELLANNAADDVKALWEKDELL